MSDETVREIHNRLCAFTHTQLTQEQRDEINTIINIIKANRCSPPAATS